MKWREGSEQRSNFSQLNALDFEGGERAELAGETSRVGESQERHPISKMNNTTVQWLAEGEQTFGIVREQVHLKVDILSGILLERTQKDSQKVVRAEGHCLQLGDVATDFVELGFAALVGWTGMLQLGDDSGEKGFRVYFG